MKKIVLSLGLLAGISASASAQASFGLKGGASLTTNTGDGVDSDDTASKIGFHGGAFVNLSFGDALSIQPEVLYSMKGSKSDEDGDNKINLNYVDIPIMLQYNADGLFFEAGPQLGILTGGEVVAGPLSIDVKDSFKSIDFGYAVGLGYKLESGPMIGLRYNGGIANIVKDSDDDAVRNSAFQLYVGYSFGGK